jgi:hypothetical protein
MNCDIIRDLLPLYHDGVCSAESRRAVEAHLETCENCRKTLAAMDAPLPEAGKAAEDDAAVVQKISEKWKQDKKRAWLKGAAIAAAVCAVVGAWYAATALYLFPVDPADMEITDVRQLSDGRVLYHFYIDDDLGLRRIRFEYDDAGNKYYVPVRALITEKRWEGSSPADCTRCLDIAEELAWAEGQGLEREITRVWYGRGEDAILLWEEGMDLPAASSADEAEWGHEPGSAAYWAEQEHSAAKQD